METPEKARERRSRNLHHAGGLVTPLVAAIVQDYGSGTVLGEETADLAST
ncbi:MAG: hypothetical protein M3414_09510 [Pseudomonadota bacterium]|nr:hypothetical protein [Pseudomonadota bacterium]